MGGGKGGALATHCKHTGCHSIENEQPSISETPPLSSPWLQTIARKNGEEVVKRAVVLRDSSNGSIELTLWGATSVDPGEALFNRVQVRASSGAVSWLG